MDGLTRARGCSVAREASGKMKTVACPATWLPGILDAATLASTAASYWMGPSILRSGRSSRAIRTASRTRSTSAPFPEAPVE